MSSKISIIIRREYMERVTKKSFIITTLLMPLFMLALMVTPVLIAEFSEPSARNVVIVDESGFVGPQIKSTPSMTIVPADSTGWQKMLEAETADAVLIIPEGIGETKVPLQLYTAGPSSMELESEIASQVNSVIETKRLKGYNIENLDEIIEAVHSDVSIMSRQLTDNGEKETSTILSYALGMILTFILYMCLLLYGQMVMTSIIEEKTNRVLEIVVSSVRPMQMMLGKICGIGLVAVTQIVIWAVLIAAMSAFLLPAILSPELSAEVAAINAGNMPATDTEVGMLQALSVIGDVGYIVKLFSLLLLFLVGGFMLYAAIYAAIGSAVDNIQDASQLQSFIIFPVVIGIVFGMTAANDPMSTLSQWMSYIPFTSPMVMMARIPYSIPGWQIIVSLVVLYISFFAMVWVAGKIYRVGIFMYGKKPNIKELVRWMRYK